MENKEATKNTKNTKAIIQIFRKQFPSCSSCSSWLNFFLYLKLIRAIRQIRGCFSFFLFWTVNGYENNLPFWRTAATAASVRLHRRKAICLLRLPSQPCPRRAKIGNLFPDESLFEKN